MNAFSDLILIIEVVIASIKSVLFLQLTSMETWVLWAKSWPLQEEPMKKPENSRGRMLRCF